MRKSKNKQRDAKANENFLCGNPSASRSFSTNNKESTKGKRAAEGKGANSSISINMNNAEKEHLRGGRGDSTEKNATKEEPKRSRGISKGKIAFTILRVLWMLIGMSFMVLIAMFIYGRLKSMANLDEELLKAAKIGDIQQARTLLDQGAKMDARLVEYKGRTAIHLAAMHGHEQMVRFLLSKGADPNVRSMEWKTPLQMATNSMDCRPGMLRTLLAAGARIEEKDGQGRTLMDYNTNEGCRKVIMENF